ncbi:MAG TPA: right-handed parallel beta-helix repeat-containing protein [Rhodanobacteraceae bacterium]|nr:right-handed parallel beta-helix repeat-containing protein [Rhodanobacteraceae bacterium]
MFNITANGTAIVNLRHLDIKNGEIGIAFGGSGILQTIETTIERNASSGISATATSSDTELVIDTGTLILDNGDYACYVFNLAPLGGGIRLDGPIEMTMTAPQTLIAFNSACKGGGLYVGPEAYAYIGSPGYNGLPAIYQNAAMLEGGGAFVAGTLKLFTTDSAHPIGLSHNSAVENGGGIYVSGTDAKLCAWDFAINDNTADGFGSAIYGNDSSIILNRNEYTGCSVHPEAVRCASPTACNQISDNTNTGADTNNALGAAIDLSGASLVGRRISLRNNNSAAAIRSTDSNVSIDECLIADNKVSGSLLASNLEDPQSESSLYLKNCTIAGNDIAIGAVVQSNAYLYLFNSILYQPDTPTLSFTGPQGQFSADSLLLDNGSNVPPGATIARGISPFVAPEAGDYHLLYNSAAVDFAAGIVSDAFDLDGNPRDVDIPDRPNFNGPRDLGAYEWTPLIRNGWFETGLAEWGAFGASWDGTQNASGGSGSGSLHYSTSGLTYRDVNVGEQCVQLAQPGQYTLDGWGKGGGSTIQSRDYAVVAWEFRHDGGAGCSSGTADASGELTLHGGTSWGHPSLPATIDVSPQQFGPHASITVRLIARDGSPTNVGGPISAWFDGITLDVTSPNDVVFENGFE